MRKGTNRKKPGTGPQSTKQDASSALRNSQLPQQFVIVLVCLGLVVSIFAVYGQLCGAGGEFSRLDDDEYVVNNEHVHAGLTLSSIAWAFSSFDASNWHPLTWLSLQADHDMHGLSAGGYHLTNIILHAANSVLLLLVLRGMTREFWSSALVAALFALHPLHVESVAWIAERKDVLSTFFWILTMGAYLKYVEQPGPGRYLLVVAAFILGLMSKPMLVTLPFVLLLLDYWPLRRWERGSESKTSQNQAVWLLVEKLPLLLVSVAASVVTIMAQGVLKETLFANQPLPQRMLNAMLAYGSYLWKTIWPNDLGPIYSQPLDAFPLWQSIVAGVVLVAITVVCMARAKRQPYLPVGWLWFLGTLVPVIGIVQVGLQTMADRYTYVPHIGLFIMIVWSLKDMLVGRCSKAALGWLSGALLLSCALTTFFQARLWQSSTVLLEHTIAVTTRNFVGHDSYGVALMGQGRASEALSQFQTAVNLEPRYAMGHFHRGLVLQGQQKWAEAAESFTHAVHLAPGMTDAQQELAMCYLKLNQMEEATIPLAALVSADPNSSSAHSNYCMALLYCGKLSDAEREGLEALRLDIRHVEANKLMGYLRAIQGRSAEAEQFYRAALQHAAQGREASAAFHLAWSLQAQGKVQIAQEMYQNLVKQYPRWSKSIREEAWRLATHPDARRRNGALALLRAQVVSQAAGDADSESLEAVAAAYAELGRFPEAVNSQQKALSLPSIKQDLREAMSHRLRLYQQSQAYREPLKL